MKYFPIRLYLLACCLVVLSLGVIPAYAQGDQDGDGLVDISDACPNAQLATTVPTSDPYYGCPDGDGDTVADPADKCPTVKGVVANEGCASDRDKDGIPDTTDKCPDTPKSGAVSQSSQYYGCADPDFDGLADPEDFCPTEEGTAPNKGCKTPPPTDQDKDGVLDSVDVCPTFPGEKGNDGCSFGYDRDGDGIPDGDDLCKSQSGTAAFKGCPTGTATPTSSGATAAPTVAGAATATPVATISGRAALPAASSVVGCVVMPNIANRAINVRANAGEDQPILRSIPDSQTYIVVAQTRDSQGRTWFQLQTGGWVADWVLDKVGTCANLPSVQAATPVPTVAPAPTAATVPTAILNAPPVEPANGGQNGLPTTRTPLSVTNAAQARQLTQQLLTPTAQVVMAATGKLLVENGTNTLQRYDLAAPTFTSTQDITLTSPLTLLAVSPDGGRSVSTAATPEGVLLTLTDLQGVIAPVSWRLDATQATFKPDGTQLVAYFFNGTISPSGTSILNFLSTDGSGNDRAVEYQGMIARVAFSPDGTRLAIHSVDSNGQNAITIIDPADPTNLIQNLPTSANNINQYGSGGLAFSPDGTRLALGTIDGQIQIWETATWTLAQTIPALPNTMITAVAFDPTGTIIAAGGGIPPATSDALPTNTVVTLLDVATSTPLTTLSGHTGSIRQLVFSADGALLLSVSDKGELFVWGVAP